METKIKVTFSDGSKRMLKGVSKLSTVNRNRIVRLVSYDGRVLDCRIAGFDGRVITIKNNSLLPLEIEEMKIMGWCYKYPVKNRKI